MRGLLRFVGLLALAFGLFVFVAISVGIVRLLWSVRPPAREFVQVIDLSGVLLSADSLIDELSTIEKDEKARAVVVRINSPGGLVGPSQEIYSALLRLNSKKPVVAALGAVAASGGYYAALGAQKIFANPGTLTASIGVIMEFANTQKLFQWAKIDRYVLKSGKFKDIGTSLREMTKDERALIEGLLLNIHNQFRSVVKERRQLDDNILHTVADGRVMTGAQALEAKLVDGLGGTDDAIREAKRLAELPEDAPVLYLESKKGLLRKLLLGEDDPQSEAVFNNILKASGFVAGLGLTGYRVWLISPLF